MPLNILVTGSRGFLGTQLCKRLRADGHKVIGWDLAHSSEPDEYRCDVNQFNQFSMLKDLDVVIHLAAEFGRLNGLHFAEQMWQTATVGLRNMLTYAHHHNAKFIFASSSEAYGTLADTHATLSEDLLDTEVPSFHNEYALSKWCGEQQVRMHLRDYLIVRPFNIYGPTEPKHQYRSFLSRLCSGQDVPVYDGVRSWLHVSDFVNSMCILIDKNAIGAFNIGSDIPSSNSILATMTGVVAGPCKPESNNVFRKVPDVSKLKSLGWEPKVSLEEGIAECLLASSCPTGTVVFS